MFTRQLQAAACIVALCMGAGPLAADTARPTGHSLVRFVCQKYSVLSGERLNRVVVTEQLSVQSIDGNDTVDGSDLIDIEGELYTEKAPFRMRIYNDVSLVSSEQTKEEIIADLLHKPAGRDVDGDLMDFSGKGRRFKGRFTFSSITPYLITLDSK